MLGLGSCAHFPIGPSPVPAPGVLSRFLCVHMCCPAALRPCFLGVSHPHLLLGCLLLPTPSPPSSLIHQGSNCLVETPH